MRGETEVIVLPLVLGEYNPLACELTIGGSIFQGLDHHLWESSPIICYDRTLVGVEDFRNELFDLSASECRGSTRLSPSKSMNALSCSYDNGDLLNRKARLLAWDKHDPSIAPPLATTAMETSGEG